MASFRAQLLMYNENGQVLVVASNEH